MTEWTGDGHPHRPITDAENDHPERQHEAINELAATPIDNITHIAFVETETVDTYNNLTHLLLIGGGTIAALLIAGGLLLWLVNT